MRATDDARLFAPSAARNRDPILGVLQQVLPPAGLVLEIASGAGEHAVHFASHLPRLQWQPSDPDASARASIDAWRETAVLPNLLPAVELDVTAEPWPVDRADAVVCINMIHISPWAATEALIRGAARRLPPDGILYLYGPYRRDGQHTAPSNEAFDKDLRRRNPVWGVRDLDDVARLAQASGLRLRQTVEMPANNLSVVFARELTRP